MISFQEELFDHVYPDMKELLTAHWNELAVKERPLDVDEERYREIDKQGLLKIFTTRDAGILIGYAPYIISSNLHDKTWMNAVCDVYYIDPQYRKQGLGKSFFEYIVQQCKIYKVNSVYFHDRLSHSHAGLFLGLGAKAVEQTYELVIK